MKNNLNWVSKFLVIVGILLALGCVQEGDQNGAASSESEESLNEDPNSEKAISPEDAGMKGKFLEEDAEEPEE